MTGIPNGMGSETICVDFDGTIFPWAELDSDYPPLPGAVDFMRKASERGYRIVIFSSRLSQSWLIEQYGERELAAEYNKQRAYIAERLKMYGIPFHDMTSEKVAARHYIDDRAVEFRNNWAEIAERIF